MGDLIIGDLISRNALLDEICKNGVYHGLTPAQRWNACRIVRVVPIVDAVPRDEYEALFRRFRHLLKSDFIHSFDEYDPKTGTYKRDIAEADKAEPVRHGRWILYDVREYADELQIPEYKCSICGRIEVIKEPYCHCGAKMDGGKEE